MLVLRRYWLWVSCFLVVAFAAILFSIGDYIYRSGTKVLCGVHSHHQSNTPKRYSTPGPGKGPFRGARWDKWANHDLSQWWLTAQPYHTVRITNESNSVVIVSWWIPASDSTQKETVIVAHGVDTNRQDFNVLLPASMLVQQGFNVLLLDLRDHGESTCEDGRHSAGQLEASDIISAANWLVQTKEIPFNKIGIHGISGGAIAALVVAAKHSEIAAFSLESPIFDFNAAARDEVVWQGYPGFLWSAAYWAGRLRGVDLMAVTPKEGINSLNGRPVQVFHGTADSRVKFRNSLDLVSHAQSIGVDVALHSFRGADHTEGLLVQPEVYYRELGSFFSDALSPIGD